jgi:hypothetical protein
MKVTDLIPDDLVAEVREMASGRNLTESLIVALREWTSIQRLRVLREKVRRKPLSFAKDFTASRARGINRT